MKYVGICQNCNETKVLDEWCRCKSCAATWWAESLLGHQPTNPDDWFVIGPKEPKPGAVDHSTLAPGRALLKGEVEFHKLVDKPADVGIQRYINEAADRITRRNSKNLKDLYPELH